MADPEFNCANDEYDSDVTEIYSPASSLNRISQPSNEVSPQRLSQDLTRANQPSSSSKSLRMTNTPLSFSQYSSSESVSVSEDSCRYSARNDIS